MSKKNDSLHAQAEMYRQSAQDRCNDYNDAAACEAVVEFEKGEIAEYFRENVAYVTGLVVERLNAVKAGEPTLPLRAFDADTLVRLLSTIAEAQYDAMGVDVDLSDEDTIAAGDELAEEGWSGNATTFASHAQYKLRCALAEYAETAAAYAKSINSASILDWVGIVDILENRKVFCSSRIADEDAKRVVELEKSAADRLRLDKIIAELPPFKPSKKTKKAS